MKQQKLKKKLTKDAEILLDSVLTSDSARFKKIYGDTYENGLRQYLLYKQVKKSKKKVFHLHLPIQYNGTKISL